jgi:hypothetical protein
MLFRLAARARPNFRPLWGAQRRFMATEKKVQQKVSIPWIIGGVSLGAAVWFFIPRSKQTDTKGNFPWIIY